MTARSRGAMTTNAMLPSVTEQLGYYVYLLIDPRDGNVFYIGKGTGSRCSSHIDEARKTKADMLGDYEKLARIREIEAAGVMVHIDILRHGLTEREAFLIESAAIDLLGLKLLTNRVSGRAAAERGRMSIADINAQYGAMPVEIEPHHRVVLLKISRQFEHGMSDDALYEATRKWWPVGPQRRALGTPTAPEWAMAVFGGVVRAVYRIDAWEQPTDADVLADPSRAKRWRFHGHRHPEMEARYVGRDVSSSLPSQNPVRYVNC